MTYEDLLQWSRKMLMDQQRDFRKSPNALHWNATIVLMLTYQQVKQAKSASTVEQLKVLLEKLPTIERQGLWPEAIIETLTGRSIEENMKLFN